MGRRFVLSAVLATALLTGVVLGVLEATAGQSTTQSATVALGRVERNFLTPVSVTCHGFEFRYSGPAVLSVTTPLTEPTVDVVIWVTFRYRTGPNPARALLDRVDATSFHLMREYRLAATRSGASNTIMWIKRNLRAQGAQYSFEFRIDLASPGGCRDGRKATASNITAVAELWTSGD